jgi:hypothetical protein
VCNVVQQDVSEIHPEGFSSTYFVDNFEVFEKVYGIAESGKVSMSISGLIYAVSVDKHITNRITFLNISLRND